MGAWPGPDWSNFARARVFLSMISVGLFVLLGLLPLDRTVHMPAILFAAEEARVVTPESAQVIRVVARPGTIVAKGDVLAQLFVPDIGQLQRQAQLRLGIATARMTAGRRDRAEFLIQQRERGLAQKQLEALKARGRQLTLRAPLTGLVTGDSASLREGQWVGRDALLFLIVSQNGARVIALLPERDSGRVAAQAILQFVPSDGVSERRRGGLLTVGLPVGEGQALPYLASRLGGVVDKEVAQGGESLLVGHLLVLALVDGKAPSIALVGTASVEARPENLFTFLFKHLLTHVLRNTRF